MGTVIFLRAGGRAKRPIDFIHPESLGWLCTGISGVGAFGTALWEEIESRIQRAWASRRPSGHNNAANLGAIRLYKRQGYRVKKNPKKKTFFIIRHLSEPLDGRTIWTKVRDGSKEFETGCFEAIDTGTTTMAIYRTTEQTKCWDADFAARSRCCKPKKKDPDGQKRFAIGFQGIWAEKKKTPALGEEL